VRYVFRHFAFLGQESLWAAEATECAADQQHFWAFHDRVFETQVPQHNVGNFSIANLEKIAGNLGLDRNQFNTCLESGRYAPYIQQAADAAHNRGVTGTPALFVNGSPIKTPATFDELLAVLDTGRS
jgi:protein-disulfide isomerase